jgi:hypothetical protein
MTRRPRYADEIAALDEAILSPEEARTRLAAAMRELDEGDELENLTALITWFRRRYPTALERLRYLRRKTSEAARTG